MSEEIRIVCESCGANNVFTSVPIPGEDRCLGCRCDIAQQYNDQIADESTWIYSSLQEMKTHLVELSAFYIQHSRKDALSEEERDEARRLMSEATEFLNGDGKELQRMDRNVSGPRPATWLLRDLRNALAPMAAGYEGRYFTDKEIDSALQDPKISHIIKSF